jgi:hypothetical protein
MTLNGGKNKHLSEKITTAQNPDTKSLGEETADRGLYYTAAVTCA